MEPLKEPLKEALTEPLRGAMGFCNRVPKKRSTTGFYTWVSSKGLGLRGLGFPGLGLRV